MKLTKCDLCGSVESKKYDTLGVAYDMHTSHDYSGTKELDVCQDCKNVIVALVKNDMKTEASNFVLKHIDTSCYDECTICFKEFK